MQTSPGAPQLFGRRYVFHVTPLTAVLTTSTIDPDFRYEQGKVDKYSSDLRRIQFSFDQTKFLRCYDPRRRF